MQKLLLAMAGQPYVQISKSDLEDDGSKNIVKELLRLGRTYLELNSAIMAMRLQSDHDRISEILARNVETVLDEYIDTLVKAEPETLVGSLNLLRLKWLCAPYARALPELAQLIKRTKSPGLLLRNAAELRLSVSPASHRVVERIIREGLDLLRESVNLWMLHGEVSVESADYFFIVDRGDIQTLVQQRLEVLRDSKFFLDRFALVLERIPIDLRLSIEWATRVLFIGLTMRSLVTKGSNRLPNLMKDIQSIDVLNETHVAGIFKEADSELKARFFSDFPREMNLIRSAFFIGRGEVFRAAMDVKGDFQEACRVVQAEDLYEYITIDDEPRELAVGDNPVILYGMCFVGGALVSRRNRESAIFKDKVRLEDGLSLSFSDLSFKTPGDSHSVYIGMSSSVTDFRDATKLPALCLQVSLTKTVLFLDGLFAAESTYNVSLDESDAKIMTMTYEANSGQLEVFAGEASILTFIFEDPLVTPKWSDCFGKSFVGIIALNSGTSVRGLRCTFSPSINTPSIKFVVIQPQNHLVRWSVYENLNGVAWILFRIKAAQELLARAWTVTKRDWSLSRLRYQMALVINRAYMHTQLSVISVGFEELRKTLINSPSVTFEYVQGYTEHALEQIAWKCGLGNRILTEALLNLVSLCETVALAILADPRAVNEKQKSKEFLQSVKDFFILLRAAATPTSLQMLNALEDLGLQIES